MRLIEFYDTILEAKEDKIAQQQGKKILAAFQADENVPTKIRNVIMAGGEEQTPLNIVLFFSKLDHTPQKKYLQWMVTQFVRGALRLEDAYKIPEILRNFEKHQHRLEKKGLDQYPTYRHMDDAVQPYTAQGQEARGVGLANFVAKPEVQDALKRSNVVYQSPRLLVVQPKSQSDSCTLGKGTKWCVAATEAQNYFNFYNKQGPLHFAFNDKGDRYGIHFERGDFMDERDRPQNVVDVIKENPEMLAAFDHSDLSKQIGRGFRDWTKRGEERISGVDLIVRAFKELNFQTDAEGQIQATKEDMMAPIKLGKAGMPVDPRADAVALEMTRRVKDKPEDVKAVMDHYYHSVKTGTAPDEIRLMLGHMKGFDRMANEHELEEINRINDIDLEDRASELGTIEDVFNETGLTLPLLHRIEEVAEDKSSGDALYYVPSKKAFDVARYDNPKQANEYHDLGDSVEFGIDVWNGEAEVEVSEPYHNPFDDVWDSLSQEKVNEVWSWLMNEHKSSTYDALAEWVEEEEHMELLYELDSDGETGENLDYEAMVEEYVYGSRETGQVEKDPDKNTIWLLLEYPILGDARHRLERVAAFAYWRADENTARGALENSLWTHFAGGVEGTTDLNYEDRTEQIPQKLEFQHEQYIESPMHIVVDIPNYIKTVSEVEQDLADYPDYDAKAYNDWDEFSWDYSWEEPDGSAINEEWGEYFYLADE